MFEGAMPVTLRGMLRGLPLEGTALLALGADRLRLAPSGGHAPLELRWTDLEGVDVAADGDAAVLALHVRGGDAIELHGDRALLHTGAQVERRATALPELTRALRAVGSRRGAPGGEHDRFFGALLDARARAERAEGWAVQLAAFGAPVLRRSLEQVLDDFAVARHPASAPDRRALQAELLELAEALLAHLDRLDRAAARVQAAEPAVRLVAWRAWVQEVRTLFEVADCCWIALLPALDAAGETAPAPAPAAWRRLLGGTARRGRPE